MTIQTTERVLQAAKILRSEGAREVYVFGSAAQGRERPGSDLDLAVVGLPAERYFAALGRLLMELLVEVDLIDLDRDHDFGDFLRQGGELRRVG